MLAALKLVAPANEKRTVTPRRRLNPKLPKVQTASSHRAKSLDGPIETNVFHCKRCDRYVAQPSASAAAAQNVPSTAGKAHVFALWVDPAQGKL